MRQFLFFLGVTALFFGCTGCNEDDPTKTKMIVDENPEYVEVEQAPQEMRENIRKNLDPYMTSLKEGRFEEHLDRSYFKIFQNTDEKQAVLDQFETFREQGIINTFDEFELVYVSPVVDLDSNWGCMIRFEGVFKVIFEDHYEGDPVNYFNQVKNTFLRCDVTYDSLSTTYTAKGIQQLYGISAKDPIDYKFINERFAQHQRMGGIIDFDNMLILKGYE